MQHSTFQALQALNPDSALLQPQPALVPLVPVVEQAVAPPLEQDSLPPQTADLPPIPNKRYFTIGEVSQACGVKQHVLRFWEQEFPQLRPVKRRGNRRYYQHHEVLLIRRIRELLYDQGFTISGALRQLRLGSHSTHNVALPDPHANAASAAFGALPFVHETPAPAYDWDGLRNDLLNLRNLLAGR